MKRFASFAALLSPASALMLIGFVLPMAWLFRLSLDRAVEGGVLIPDLTPANYVQFVHDKFYLAILGRTLVLGVVVSFFTLLCAYPIALFLFRTRSRWRGILAVLTISPMLVSSVVRTFSWMAILGDRGLVNHALLALGLIDHPLALMNNMLGVTIGLVQIEMPVMILALIAGLSRLDPTLEEAAQTLGARPWRAFVRVTLPLSAPGIILGCLVTFVQVMSSFVTPTLLGGGRVYVMATTIYEEALETLNWPLAATISIILILVFGLCALFYERIGGRWQR
ncbi:MAG TPA: ABC transporter permease [Acetobacteraceae bacterium]|nr:ABC transporter permease [Acetobacteraceae bacterium]